MYKRITTIAILLPFLFLFFIGPKAEASDPTKSEMYLGDYEFSKDGKGYSEVKYVESTSGKIIKERKGSGSYTTKYYYTNHQGSTVWVLDSTGRKTTEFASGKMKYFPYGDLEVSKDVTKLPVDDTYTGQKRDSESDLMFYNARLYDPSTGVFLQADSKYDGLNKYMYVGGNAINKIDPLGNEQCNAMGICAITSGDDMPALTASSAAGISTIGNMSDWCSTHTCTADPQMFYKTLMGAGALAVAPVAIYGLAATGTLGTVWAAFEVLQTAVACATGNTDQCVTAMMPGPAGVSSIADDLMGLRAPTVVRNTALSAEEDIYDIGVYVNQVSGAKTTTVPTKALEALAGTRFSGESFTPSTGKAVMIDELGNTYSGPAHDHLDLIRYMNGDESIGWDSPIAMKDAQAVFEQNIFYGTGINPPQYITELRFLIGEDVGPVSQNQVVGALRTLKPDYYRFNINHPRYINPYRYGGEME